jgi:hypothetical protein
MDALGELLADSVALVHPKPGRTDSVRERKKAHARNRVSNGNSLLGREVDGRTLWARRLRDLIEEHISDLGGDTNVSASERSLVRRASTMEVELERMEVAFARAGAANADALDLYQRLSNSLRRLLESVGLRRRPRDITGGLSLGEVLRQGMIDHGRGT